MKYGLDDSVIEKICGVFVRFPAIEKAVLYGSRAKDTYREGSDIDLTLLGARLTPDDLGNVADVLDDLLLPYMFDLSIFDTLEHEKLRDHIKRIGVTFYERPKSGKTRSGGAVRGWYESTLGDVICEMRNGVNCKQDKSGVGDRITRIETISNATFNLERMGYSILSHEQKEKYKLVSGDILFSHINSVVHVGKTALLEQNCEIYHGINLMLFRSHNFMVPKFLQYYLKMIFQAGYWRTLCKQSVNQASVNQTDIKKVPIKYPSIPEQKRIVAILDEAFAGIDQAIVNTEKNLASARELFESYLNIILTQKGEGWVKYSLNDICEIMAKLIDPKEDDFIDLPHLGAGNMVSQSDELVEVKTAREEGLISGKFVFEQGVVLYSKIRPYLMKVCRPDFKGLCSADVYPLMPIKDILDRDFLFYLLLSKNFTDYAIKGSARAGMPKVNRSHLFSYTIHIPSIDKQKILAAQIDEIYSTSKQLADIFSKKLTALNELKQSLLQKAFSGELTTEINVQV